MLCHAQHAPNRRTAGLLLATAGFSVLTDCRAYAAAAAPACELTTTPSGLQFCDTKEGGGDEAQAGTLVRVHYDGRLESNGSKFDSSYDRGKHCGIKFEYTLSFTPYSTLEMRPARFRVPRIWC